MSKDGTKDGMAKARAKVAKAQNRYMKAVAKGERQMRDVRALVHERIARARSKLELRTGELAELEVEVHDGIEPPEKAADQATTEETAPAKTAKTSREGRKHCPSW